MIYIMIIPSLQRSDRDYEKIYQALLQEWSFDEIEAKEIVESLQGVDAWEPCYTAEEIRKSIYQSKDLWYATV